MRERRIRITGKPKREIDIDLLTQAILAIVEQQLAAEASVTDDHDNGSSGDAA